MVDLRRATGVSDSSCIFAVFVAIQQPRSLEGSLWLGLERLMAAKNTRRHKKDLAPELPVLRIEIQTNKRDTKRHFQTNLQGTEQ